MTKDQDTSKLWGGRFSEATDTFVQRFTASVQFDQRMAAEDIAGSLAHASMLCNVGVLDENELQEIQRGLAQVQSEIENGSFQWSVELEDVHMNIEARLTELIGVTGKKLHTGRSRNDQVATDIRLYLRGAIDRIAAELTRLQRGTIEMAAQNTDTIMPGFTHLQTAQPVSFGHHLLAWNEMLERDHSRLMDCRVRLNQSPLGAAALAGTTYPIDREQTASALGFDKPTENSLDSVSDRDFAIEFCSFAALLMTHLSRISEELVLWTSAQFDFIELPDRFCTGSSIMPQKKDKEPLFDTVDTVLDSLRAFGDMIPAIRPRPDQMREAARRGFSTATDLADYLVGLGLPFRDAHEVVGKAVAHGVDCGLDLAEMELETLQGFCADIGEDVFDVLTLEGSLAARDHLGGTAPSQVAAAAQRALARLEQRD
jgi:argininosuccinate lyase